MPSHWTYRTKHLTDFTTYVNKNQIDWYRVKRIEKNINKLIIYNVNKKLIFLWLVFNDTEPWSQQGFTIATPKQELSRGELVPVLNENYQLLTSANF